MYTKCIQNVYKKECIQKMYTKMCIQKSVYKKMYTKCIQNVYKITKCIQNVYKLYTKCIQNVYKKMYTKKCIQKKCIQKKCIRFFLYMVSPGHESIVFRYMTSSEYNPMETINRGETSLINIQSLDFIE